MRKNKIVGMQGRRHRRGVRHPRLNYSHNIIKDDCIVIDYSKKQRPIMCEIYGHGWEIFDKINNGYYR